MAANDEFPRAWVKTLVQLGGATDPIISIPAAPGIAHVIDSVEVHCYSSVNASIGVGLTVKDNATIIAAAQNVWTSGGAAWIESDLSLTGPFPGTPGNVMNVIASGGANDTSIWFSMLVVGHDI